MRKVSDLRFKYYVTTKVDTQCVTLVDKAFLWGSNLWRAARVVAQVGTRLESLEFDVIKETFELKCSCYSAVGSW